MSCTLVTQSRSASFIASLSVPAPDVTGLSLGAEQRHARDVRRLPLDVGRAHVDLTRHPVFRTHSGDGDAVLARTGLGDDARLAHAPRQQICPRQLLILCEPVWFSSSRLK